MKKEWTLPTSIFITITILIILLDQLTKHFVRTYMLLGERIYLIGKYINLTYTTNTGASFSILSDYSFILGIIAVFVVIAIIIFYARIPREYRLAFALILAGTVGNLIDRMMYGAVTDFMNITIWPIFNVADVAITTAAILLIREVWLEEKREEKEANLS